MYALYLFVKFRLYITFSTLQHCILDRIRALYIFQLLHFRFEQQLLPVHINNLFNPAFSTNYSYKKLFLNTKILFICEMFLIVMFSYRWQSEM